ncbi:MAG: tetratricopeptide repeat protein, partial [Gammaproteobacteria bacterium]|nr:tetratricopeptide repeat protein [Gammaproteobacteria bacterium]
AAQPDATAAPGAGAATPAVTAALPSGPQTAANAMPALPPPIPPQAAAEFARALQAMKAGNVTDAELDLKQLTIEYPAYKGPRLDLGIIYLQSGRLAEAQAAFQAVLALDADDAVANDELGMVLRRQGKFGDAEAAYSRAIAARPDYLPAHLNLGILYDLYLGHPHKALDQYQRYVALGGGDKRVPGWIIELRHRVGLPAQAPAAAPKSPAASKEPT